MEDTKCCTKCGVVKSRTQFGRCNTADGNKASCKECISTWMKDVYKNRPAARAKLRANGVAYNARERTKLLEQYGGKCTCCGEDNFAFLTIHHIDNDGAQHRREIGDGGNVLRAFLKRNNYPKDKYSCLCFNCNASLGFHGYCPHNRPASEEIANG